MKSLVGLAVTVCLIFLLANCAPPVSMSVLAPMSPDQHKYLQRRVLPQFERQNRCRVTIISMIDSLSVEQSIAAAPSDLGLVKVPFTASRRVAQEKQLLVLDSIPEYSGGGKLKQELLLTSFGAVQGRQFFIPRKFETRIIVYRKSKVQDALRSWRRFKNPIDQAMKKINGFGLPANYLLEENPEEWDFFDIFVLGWFWSQGVYNEKKSPRIAHPVREEGGLALRQIDHLIQFNADSASVLAIQGEAVLDMFQWEAVYAATGVYNPNMWKQNWTSSQLWKAFGEDEVFLSFLTQKDCFYIYGTGRDSMHGFLKEPQDMGVATMPAACSVELDSRGMPLRTGTKSVMTGGWWWGIPVRCPDPALSMRLAEFLSGNQVQIQECSNFGMIPVRKDVLSHMSIMFGDGWINQVYATSFRQLMSNGFSIVAGDHQTDQISSLYQNVWLDIVAGGNWSENGISPDRLYIDKLIEQKYRAQARHILSGKGGAVYD